MARYNHQICIAFSVVSDHPDGEDITPAMLRGALEERIRDLDDNHEWEEACLPPVDSEEED